MLKSSILALAAVFVVSVLPVRAAEPASPVGESQVAAIGAGGARLGRQAVLPTVLSKADVETYRAIAEAQEQGRWAVADRLMARLADPLLVGSLLAQRYLANGYRADGKELADWLTRYGDQAAAPEIYELARQRLGARAPRPALSSTDAGSLKPVRDEDATWEDFAIETNRNLAPAERRRADNIKDRFRQMVRRGDFDRAADMLDERELRGLFESVDFDELKTVLAAALFSAGDDAGALRWANAAAERSGDVLPEAHWVAGLATWRQGHHARSARHFEAVANATDASPWLVSAGAYWAARANLADHHPELVNHWLHLAAANPRAFYGLLARRALGQNIYYSWEARPFTDLDADTLLRIPAARRALALIQLGDRGHAEDELDTLATNASPAVAQSLLALAYAGNLAGLAVRLGDSVGNQDGRLHDSAAYPVPDWRPASGWTVDRALILAIARQESGFNPRAKSPAGAVGLMQLMPRTARALGARGRLTDPQVNLDLGQRFVKNLLDDDSIHGNLLFLAAAYNSGPGNVARWLQTVHHQGDALMFMESIPARETRAFVARVMTNYWAYRNRLGLTSPSLDSISAGEWPMYDAASTNVMAVKNVAN